MRKIFIALLLTYSFECCRSKHQPNTCIQFDGAGMGDEKVELLKDKVRVIQTQSGMHDTVTVDLIVVLKDQYLQPIPGAWAEIDSQRQQTNKEGKASFIAFSNDGTFTAKFNDEKHGCVQINHLKFRSGEIRWLDVIMPQ